MRGQMDMCGCPHIINNTKFVVSGDKPQPECVVCYTDARPVEKSTCELKPKNGEREE